MGLKSYAELRDEEDASKRKRATLVSILKRVFNRRFCVLSAAALLAFCIFVAFNIQSNPAQSNPVVANNFMTKPSEFVETTVNSANHISGSCDQVLTDHDIDPKAFGPIVAHSIHSLSLDDLRFCKKTPYFCALLYVYFKYPHQALLFSRCLYHKQDPGGGPEPDFKHPRVGACSVPLRLPLQVIGHEGFRPGEFVFLNQVLALFDQISMSIFKGAHPHG